MSQENNWDFSEYKHTRTIFKSDSDKQIIVDEIKKHGTNCGYVKFINDECGMSVFGDFGNYIFNRPFKPHPEFKICRSYACEKLRISSIQSNETFDSEATEKELIEYREEIKEQGYTSDEIESITEVIDQLISHVDDKLEYEYFAYREQSVIDCDEIPYVKESDIQLTVVFEAFDAICNKMKEVLR